MNSITAKFVVQIANALTTAVESPDQSSELDVSVQRERELVAGALLAIHGQILLDRSARRLFGDLLLIEGLQKQVARQAARSTNAELIASLALSTSDFGYRLAEGLTTDYRVRDGGSEATTQKPKQTSIGLPLPEAQGRGVAGFRVGATSVTIAAGGKSATFGPTHNSKARNTTPKTNGDVWRDRGIHPDEELTLAERAGWIPSEGD